MTKVLALGVAIGVGFSALLPPNPCHSPRFNKRRLI
jgi:hypothetical protein